MRAAILLVLGACAASDLGPSQPDGGQSSDAAGGCEVFLTFDPAQPIAAPDTVVRATANVSGSFGVPTFSWTVTRDNAALDFTRAQADGSQITFAATTPGVIHVEVGVGGGAFCPNAPADLNVLADGDVASYRLRVSAPPAPPQERSLAFPSGTSEYAYGTFVVDPGRPITGVVRDAAAQPVAAYLRFIPHGRPDAYVETFADSTGHFGNVAVLDELHDVLVIPMVAGYVPYLVTDWVVGTAVILVDTGTTASGVVKGPGGAGIVGASVQIALDGVPSTTTMTTAGGAFTVRYHPNPGALVTIDVLPPASTGLPRLAATSASFDLGTSIAVQYAAALAPRDLAGVEIDRGGSPLANTPVAITGTIGNAGSVTAGAAAIASGAIRATGATSGAGLLPSMKAPNSPVSVVVTVAADDVSLIPLNLASAPPAKLDAVAPVPQLGTVVDRQNNPLDDVTIVATPTGDLALAGAQPLVATSSTGGGFALPIAANATYALLLHDVAGRGAPFGVASATTATFPLSAMLPIAVRVTGSVAETGVANPIAAAAITVLCKTCAGIDRTRPLAEAASTPSGTFTIAVPELP